MADAGRRYRRHNELVKLDPVTRKVKRKGGYIGPDIDNIRQITPCDIANDIISFHGSIEVWNDRLIREL